MRTACLLVGLVAMAGCQSLRSPADALLPSPASAVESSGPTEAPPSPAPVARPVEESRPPEAEPAEAAPDLLALMAECLARGDRPAAAIHLEAYVKQYPDQLLFRLQLAELLVQIGKDATARWHYEKFVARAQGERGNIGKYLVHAHTRLMEIAQRADDRYSELFHRGVGLILLVREQDGEPDRDDALLEELLCKSLRALTEASELKPGSLRVRAYLAEAYERTGNRRAADREREACRNSPTGNELTGFERKQVQLLMDREKN